jgi:hypothetical protein
MVEVVAHQARQVVQVVVEHQQQVELQLNLLAVLVVQEHQIVIQGQP